MNYIIRFFRLIKNNIGKISIGFFFIVIFLFVLFPFGDLSDFISSQVSSATNNKVYLQFNQMHINPLSPSLSLENVLVETDQIENLSIQNLTAIPSIMSLVTKKPGGQINADGIFSGNISAKLTPKSGGKDENPRSKLELSIDKVSLKEIKKSLHLSVPISGTLNLKSSADIDLTFSEQPDGDLNFQIQKFEMNSAMVTLPDLGGLNLPEIKFSSVQGKSKFQGGKYVIESVKLGSSSDDLSGTITGNLNLILQSRNGQIIPLVNSYTLSIDLFAKPAFKDRALFFLNFISQFQKEEIGGTRYKFKVATTNPMMPPQMSPLQ